MLEGERAAWSLQAALIGSPLDRPRPPPTRANVPRPSVAWSGAWKRGAVLLSSSIMVALDSWRIVHLPAPVRGGLTLDRDGRLDGNLGGRGERRRGRCKGRRARGEGRRGRGKGRRARGEGRRGREGPLGDGAARAARPWSSLGLALSEAEVWTARHSAEVKRAARNFAVLALIGVGFLAAFAFLNVAAFSGLSTTLSPWLSALVLAAVWLVIAGLASVVVIGHLRRSPLWGVFTARPTEAIDELEQTRKEAGEAVQETIGQLVPALSIEIATAAIPSAGGIASGVVGAGEELLEASDEIVDSIIDELPAGSVVNQIWGVVLMPGRFGLRVATTGN